MFFSAVYGFSIGLIHSLNFACRNLIKFPALIIVTSLLCCLAFWLASRLITGKLTFAEVQHLGLTVYHDVSLMLFSLSPCFVFMALVFVKPDDMGLNEYPLFLFLNVAAIAVSGTVALVQRGRGLVRTKDVSGFAAVCLLFCWLSISLFTGAQCAWYLRPFCGVSTIPASETPFMLGSRPDIRGDTSFYMAVYHIIEPPPLDDEYHNFRW